MNGRTLLVVGGLIAAYYAQYYYFGLFNCFCDSCTEEELRARGCLSGEDASKLHDAYGRLAPVIIPLIRPKIWPVPKGAMTALSHRLFG